MINHNFHRSQSNYCHSYILIYIRNDSFWGDAKCEVLKCHDYFMHPQPTATPVISLTSITTSPERADGGLPNPAVSHRKRPLDNSKLQCSPFLVQLLRGCEHKIDPNVRRSSSQGKEGMFRCWTLLSVKGLLVSQWHLETITMDGVVNHGVSNVGHGNKRYRLPFGGI